MVYVIDFPKPYLSLVSGQRFCITSVPGIGYVVCNVQCVSNLLKHSFTVYFPDMDCKYSETAKPFQETQHNLRAMDDLIFEHRRLQDIDSHSQTQRFSSASVTHPSHTSHQVPKFGVLHSTLLRFNL